MAGLSSEEVDLTRPASVEVAMQWIPHPKASCYILSSPG
jgi:hypothetical protein